jgi:type IV pilus assembly protein PilF
MRIFKIIIALILMNMLVSCHSNKSSEKTPPIEEDVVKPKSEIAIINSKLGIAYLEQKDVQRAKQKLLLALEQGPGIPEPWYSMGYFLESTGNSAEASKHYLKAIEVAPKRGDAHNNYGTFLCRAGQYQASVKQFMIAANTMDYLDPAAAYENAGLCSMKMRAYSQAAGYFQQALLKDPARTSSLLKLAEADIKLDRLAHAKEMLREYALVADPTPEYQALNQQLTGKAVKNVG